MSIAIDALVRDELAAQAARAARLEALLIREGFFPKAWSLTRMEARLLGALVENEFVGREAALIAMHGRSGHVSVKNLVATHMNRLRRKLERLGAGVRYDGSRGYFIARSDRARLREEALASIDNDGAEAQLKEAA